MELTEAESRLIGLLRGENPYNFSVEIRNETVSGTRSFGTMTRPCNRKGDRISSDFFSIGMVISAAIKVEC